MYLLHKLNIETRFIFFTIYFIINTGWNMKKILNMTFIFITMFLFIDKVSAKSINVKLKKCIDGDTAIFTYKKEELKARFLAIDTPETKHSTKGEQPYGEEASNYTCKKLENAKKIVLEYDDKSDEKDLYNRHLVWVWLDDKLLQKDLISKGYAKVAYLYGKYKYVDELNNLQEKAQSKKIGIWSLNEDESNKLNDKDDFDSFIDSLFNKDGKFSLYGLFTGLITIIVALLLKKIYKKG